ncbi:GGDEF domain-containing protein [Vibrio sonorensis]|uniref:GGDEF domain-containing protein n=1 Tax=Vibrio sonorensis TaxID=1004316 RepID=UPI0008D9ECAB|nr:GGDEF domain-containing protein [Vibrio sonorensis]
MTLYYSRSVRSGPNIELRCLMITLAVIFIVNTPLGFIKSAKERELSFQLQSIVENLHMRQSLISSYLSFSQSQLVENSFKHPALFNDLVQSIKQQQSLVEDISLVSISKKQNDLKHREVLERAKQFYQDNVNRHKIYSFYRPEYGLLTELAPVYKSEQLLGFLIIDIRIKAFTETKRDKVLLIGQDGYIYSSSVKGIEVNHNLSAHYPTIFTELKRAKRLSGLLEDQGKGFVFRRIETLNNQTHYIIMVLDSGEIIPQYFYGILLLFALFIGGSYYLYKLHSEKKELSKISYIDALSGLHNRHYLQKIEKQQVVGKDYYVAIFDIDHFKSVNDKYGHDVGDQVIKRVANIIKSRIRVSDYAFRIGGEEFVVLVKTHSENSAQAIFNRIRTDTERLTHAPSVTISGGYVCVSSTLTKALKKADEFLYQAKKSGRNLVFGLDKEAA